MPDWTQKLTAKEAADIVANPNAPRYAARDDRGQATTRYAAPTKAELTRIKGRAGAD